MKLSEPQNHILLAVARGHFLKSHRDVEGGKVFQLHALNGKAQDVSRADVEALCALGLMDSNKKFPAATYWLTDSGKTLAAQLPAPPEQADKSPEGSQHK
jgi:hypothetical protein